MLSCPDCANDLRLLSGNASAEGEVDNGMLQCTGCERSYPISYRIPRLLPNALLAEQHQEIAARDEQVKQYDEMWFLSAFGVFEIPTTIGNLRLSHGVHMLEAGCGTGRMTTEFAKRVETLVSLDFSFESLRENDRKLRAHGIGNVHLVQGDLCHLPLKPELFDRVVSCQVIEHVPTSELRSQAIERIEQVAKPGAVVVLSAYQHNWWIRHKQGMHDGGIPFFRFTRSEFTKLLMERFSIEFVTGSLLYLFLGRCRKAASSQKAEASIPWQQHTPLV